MHDVVLPSLVTAPPRALVTHRKWAEQRFLMIHLLLNKSSPQLAFIQLNSYT